LNLVQRIGENFNKKKERKVYHVVDQPKGYRNNHVRPFHPHFSQSNMINSIFPQYPPPYHTYLTPSNISTTTITNIFSQAPLQNNQ
jgi:hypothetical protein